MERLEKYPAQRRAGVIEFPDLIPIPYISSVELKTTGGLGYGLGGSQNTVYGKVELSEQDIVYLNAIGFDLVRLSGDGTTVDVRNTFLPLSSENFIADGTNVYLGHDFYWSFYTSDQRKYTTGFERLASSLCQNKKRAWKLPAEWKIEARQFVQLEATPLAGGVALDEFRLVANLYGYKMVRKPGN